MSEILSARDIVGESEGVGDGSAEKEGVAKPKSRDEAKTKIAPLVLMVKSYF